MTDIYKAPSSNIGGAILSCKGCGKEVHSFAAVCPHCGMAQRSRSYKNKNIAGLLAMVFGAFGVHRFYLGQWWGVVYLLLFWTGIPSIISFVEAIVMWACNVEGWDRKYNEGKPAAPHEKSGAGTIILIVVLVGFFGIALLGILAAIAIPAYHDYTIRARVNEALVQTYGVRSSIVEYYGKNDVLPQRNSDIGLSRPNILPSGHEVEVTRDGFVILFSGEGAQELQNKSIEYIPYSGEFGIEWDCTGGSLEARYKPTQCRGSNDESETIRE